MVGVAVLDRVSEDGGPFEITRLPPAINQPAGNVGRGFLLLCGIIKGGCFPILSSFPEGFSPVRHLLYHAGIPPLFGLCFLDLPIANESRPGNNGNIAADSSLPSAGGKMEIPADHAASQATHFGQKTWQSLQPINK